MRQYDSVESQAMQETRSPPSQGNGNFALLIVFCATCLLIGGMIADRQRVALAFVCGVSFFSFLVVMVMLVQTGQLVSAWKHYQSEKTIREQNRMQYEIYVRETPQLVQNDQRSLPLEESDQRSFPTSNFVPARPAADEQVKVDSYAWVMGLFKSGQPDPERILSADKRSPDQVQAKKPRLEVLEYLLSLEMIRGGAKGEMLFFNQKTYNSLRKCQQAIKYGVPLRRTEGDNDE